MIEVKPQIFHDVWKPRSNLKPGAPVGGRRTTRGHRGRALEKKGSVISCFTKFQTKDKHQRATYVFGLFKVIVTVYFGIFQSSELVKACVRIFFSFGIIPGIIIIVFFFSLDLKSSWTILY